DFANRNAVVASLNLSGGYTSADFSLSSAGGKTLITTTSATVTDYSALSTPGLTAIVQNGAGTVNKGGANGVDHLTGVHSIIDNGTGRSNGDVFEVDATEYVTANGNNFNYLIELSQGVNLAYGVNFTGISEFVSNVGNNTVNFASDTHFAYLFGSS